VDGQPCVTWVGNGSAGHYVKMVHNGIEYGLMQLIAESYDLMRRGLGLSNDELHAVYREWNEGELQSFLIEITATIFRKKDERTGKRLVDVVLDVARQKGTGKWTSQDALDLHTPVPTVDAAVTLRNLSDYEEVRAEAYKIYRGPVRAYDGERERLLEELRGALYTASVITYAQGLDLLARASTAHGYGLDLAGVARIWRGGCIIRAALLEDVRAAYRANPKLPHLLLDPGLAEKLIVRQAGLRAVVRTTAELGIPAPALMASLAYFDSLSAGRLPANLIQAQRDFFGAHTVERTDEKGTFHARWDEP
jgi:6-phosphogluconate dehydrogenase